MVLQRDRKENVLHEKGIIKTFTHSPWKWLPELLAIPHTDKRREQERNMETESVRESLIEK